MRYEYACPGHISTADNVWSFVFVAGIGYCILYYIRFMYSEYYLLLYVFHLFYKLILFHVFFIISFFSLFFVVYFISYYIRLIYSWVLPIAVCVSFVLNIDFI